MVFGLVPPGLGLVSGLVPPGPLVGCWFGSPCPLVGSWSGSFWPSGWFLVWSLLALWSLPGPPPPCPLASSWSGSSCPFDWSLYLGFCTLFLWRGSRFLGLSPKICDPLVGTLQVSHSIIDKLDTVHLYTRKRQCSASCTLPSVLPPDS